MVAFARKKRKYQASLDKAGASRVFEMIHAAIVGTEQGSKHSICRRYIPQDPHDQILATNSLQEYDVDKQWDDLKDPIKKTPCSEMYMAFETQEDFLDKIVLYGLKVLSEKGKIKFPEGVYSVSC